MDASYFERLEKVRGKCKKMKVVEQAKEAVLHGVADEEKIKIAANGAKVCDDGEVLPVQETKASVGNHVNGSTPNGHVKNAPSDAAEVVQPVRESMDISLHNFGDYTEGT